MEMGVLEGEEIEVLGFAPFGDPMELTVRGCNLSIRAAEAREVEVQRTPSEAPRAAAASPLHSAPSQGASEPTASAGSTGLLERVR
jgi:hypothetical protein